MGGLFGGGGGGQAPEGHFVTPPGLNIPNMDQLAGMAGSRLNSTAPWMNSGNRTVDYGFQYSGSAPTAQIQPYNQQQQQGNAMIDQQRGQQMGGMGQNYFSPGQQQGGGNGFFPQQPQQNLLPLFMSNYPMFPWSTPPWLQGMTGSGGFGFGNGQQGGMPPNGGGHPQQPPGGGMGPGGGSPQMPPGMGQPQGQPPGSLHTGANAPTGGLPPRNPAGPSAEQSAGFAPQYWGNDPATQAQFGSPKTQIFPGFNIPSSAYAGSQQEGSQQHQQSPGYNNQNGGQR